jgi:hypothetical protein
VEGPFCLDGKAILVTLSDEMRNYDRGLRLRDPLEVEDEDFRDIKVD